jgi:hypothetical protein
MLEAPYWLGVEFVDDASKHREEFTAMYDSFIQTFYAEERRQHKRQMNPLAGAMHHALCSGSYWIFHCFTSIDLMPSIVEGQIFPFFGCGPTSEEEYAFSRNLSHFWSLDSKQFVQQELAERAQYNLNFQTHYETAKPSKLATTIIVDM